MNLLATVNFKSSRFLLNAVAGAIIFLFATILLFDFLKQDLPTLTILISIAGVMLSFLLLKKQNESVYKPLKSINGFIELLSQGKLEMPVLEVANLEVEEVVASLTQLTNGSKRTTEFAREMGKGNFKAVYTPLSEEDILGNALLEMQKSMVAIAEEERKRNWVNEGLAKFSELLRMDTDNVNKFSENILTNLIKYVDANQGTFYVLDTEDQTLELTACYAWGRKKHIGNKIKVGEGIAGQVVLEKEAIFLTDIPEGYIRITSGLGQANPNSILVMPLKYNEEVFGILEMASFKLFEPYQREFLDKLCVSIASSISTVKTNMRTQTLLEASIVQSRELKEKDGIMRQNIEEMRATQEDMERKELEMRHMEWKTNAILEGCVECIIAFNHKGTIEFFNKAAQDIWGVKREEAIGTNISKFLPIIIAEEASGCEAFYQDGNRSTKFTGKTELTVVNQQNEEATILCSISENKIGSSCFFTAFIQNMTVDIF